MVDQQADLICYAITLLNGGLDTVLRNVVELRVAVVNCPVQPYQVHTAPALTLLANAARFVAQLVFASSFDTHVAFASSACAIAFPTC